MDELGALGSLDHQKQGLKSEFQRVSYEKKLQVWLSLWNLYATVGLKPQELPWWNLKLAPTHGGQEKNKDADHYRLVCRRFNKQGNSHTSLVLGSCMTNRSPPLLVRILRIYPDLNRIQSHIYPDRLNDTLFSQGYVGLAPTVGTVCSIYSSSQGKGWRASDDPSPANGSTMIVTSSWWPPPTITLGKAKQHWGFTMAEWVGEYGERGKETFRKDVSRRLLSKVASV